MSGIKRRVFTLVKELKETTVKELSEKLGEPYAKVYSAVLNLAKDELVDVETKDVTYLKITEEGKKALEEGFPEYMLRDGESVQDAKARLGDRLPIAIARMKAKGFGKIEKGIIKIENRPPIEEDPQYKLLKRVAEGGVILEELREEEQKVARELLRRKMVVKDQRSVAVVRLTEKGEKTDPREVLEEERITLITPDLISKRKAEYESRVKPYDPKIEVKVPRPGRKHLITVLMEKVRSILIGMGFKEILPDTPVISAFRNFDALFVPQNHPARQIHDTFYLLTPKEVEDFTSDLAAAVRNAHVGDLIEGYKGWGTRSKKEAMRALLRTHTTAVTIKRLAEHPKKPQRVFVIGRCYRNEKIDATHLAEFFQIDGIVYEDKMTLKHLLGILRDLYYELGFKEVRFRPSYFPFTSPSVEVIGKREDKRIELGGAGIFRPEVVKVIGINEPVLAFGLGFERLAMLRAGIKDIREVYTSDIEKIARTPLPKQVIRL